MNNILRKTFITLITLGILFGTAWTVQAQEPTGGPALHFRAAADYSASFNGLGVLVMQNGEIIFEEYHRNYTENSSSHVASVTKSFWGPTVALMIQEGILQGFDQKASEVLTEWADNQDKKDITIRHLMTLSSGLSNDVELRAVTGWRGNLYDFAVNNTSLESKPGEKFEYGPASYYVLGALMNRALANSGSQYGTFLEYLNAKLFSPIGIIYALAA